MPSSVVWNSPKISGVVPSAGSMTSAFSIFTVLWMAARTSVTVGRPGVSPRYTVSAWPVLESRG